jgi:hypothetical protein
MIIDGKQYVLHNMYMAKFEAVGVAKGLRKKGFYARIQRQRERSLLPRAEQNRWVYSVFSRDK